MDVTKAGNIDAAAVLKGVFDRARRRQLSLAELMQVGEALAKGGRQEQILDLYKTWIAFNDDNPLVHVACFNYGVALSQAGDLPGAVQVLRRAIAHQPDFGPAHVNLGRALEDCKLIDQAVAQWRKFIDATAELTPDRISHRLMVLQHTGRVLESAGQLEHAEEALWRAIELQPTKPEAIQHWISARQHQCKWPLLTPSTHVTERQLLDGISPMTLACFVDDPLFQLAKAYRYQKGLVGRLTPEEFKPASVRARTGTGQRLRVGYLSSDFREHVVGFALGEVFELHDKSRIELFAYYCGEPRQNDAVQERYKAAVDHWRDITPLDDAAAARQIAEDEIDVLIDVNGYTKGARTRIFAFRPAPVIMNFFGYPGTMATPFHQYIISDGQIIPPGNEIYFSEKVLRTDCYQPIDRKRQIAATPTREEVGLPADGFVYVCFNGMQKITEPVFSRWLAILAATPGSVLWLLAGNEVANKRLRDKAEAAGIDGARLIFAPKVPNPLHMARIALGDLFLDTFPYGAHSTAADVLTMGLPVLTVPGKSFHARVCAGMITAAGIPEMVCETADQYVEKAIAFAHDRDSLAAVRASLAAQRDTCTLRDAPALTRRLEELYWDAQGAAERGETPVPDLRNLDVYYEVGAELMGGGSEFESEEAYRDRYRKKLFERNAQEPVGPDSRLWPSAGGN